MNIKKLQRALESLVGERINIKFRSSTTKITSMKGVGVMAVSDKSIFLEIDNPNHIEVRYPKPYVEIAIDSIVKITFY